MTYKSAFYIIAQSVQVADGCIAEGGAQCIY